MILRILKWLGVQAPPPPSTHPILVEIDRRGLELLVFRHSWRDPHYYNVTIRISAAGVECEVKGTGLTFDTALADAWRKWP